MSKNLNQWAKNFLPAEISDPNEMTVRVFERSYGPWHKEIWVKTKSPRGAWGKILSFCSPKEIEDFTEGLRRFNELSQEDKDAANSRWENDGAPSQISFEDFWPGDNYYKQNTPYTSDNYRDVLPTASETIEALCQALEDAARAAPGVVNPEVVEIV